MNVEWSVFFFKQKTAYEMRISDWSSDVCSSDLSRLDRNGAVEDTENAPEQGESGVVGVPTGQERLGRLRSGGGRLLRTAGRSSNADQIGRASCRERVCQYV